MFSSQARSPQARPSHDRPRPERARGAARVLAAAVACVLAAALAGCSGDAVRAVATDAGYGPKAVAVPDFVAASRPRETPDYMAVGVDAPRRAERAKSSAGQRALEAELEGARGRNEARGRDAERAGRAAGKPTAGKSSAGKPSADTSSDTSAEPAD